MEEKKIEKNPMDMTEEELYRALAGRINKYLAEGNFSDSHYMPMIMKRMCSPEDARILLNLPGFTNDVAPKVGMTEEEVESRLKVLGEKALAFATRRGWFMPRHIVQFHDGSLTNPKFDKEYGDEWFALWDAFCELEWYPDPRGALAGVSDVKRHRVIPDHRALAEGVEPAPYEDLD